MRRTFSWVSVLIVAIISIYASVSMASMPRTYDGSKAAVPVYDLLRDPASYDDSEADGAAAVIVQQDLEKTHAINSVTSIVFDFRGYDTMGEAFILMTAVGGATVILFAKKPEKKEEKKDE